MEYLCIISDTSDAESIQCLSPQVMRWSESTWILNVGPYLNYWDSIARQTRQSIHTLWSQILQQSINPEQPVVEGNRVLLKPDFIAGGGRSPWEALLVARQLQHAGHSGLVRAGSQQTRYWLHQLSWAQWLAYTQEFGQFITANPTRAFRAKGLNQALDRLKDTLVRLRVNRPIDMGRLPSDQVQRRYGKTVAALGCWTSDVTGQSAHTPPYVFPWVNWQFREPPSVVRHLEQPVWEWPHIDMFLKDDLDRLCEVAQLNSGDGVTQLDWTLRFDDGTVSTTPVKFRNPHPLATQIGHHKTALMQFQYQFQEIETRSIYGLAGWTIHLAHQMALPDHGEDLFGNLGTTDDLETSIRQIENELPVPVYRYRMGRHWIPEQSAILETDRPKAALPSSKDGMGISDTSFEVAAKARPFFTYADPRPVSQNAAFCRHQFLEVCPHPWWESHWDAFERIYTKVIDSQGRAYWVFQCPAGQWVCHGLFG